MDYSIDMLTTVTECDALLLLAGKEKSSLEYRKISLVRQKASMSETGTEVDLDLAAVTTEVAAYKTIVATLPEGDAKEENVRKLKRAELRLMALTKKDRNYGVVSLITVESDIARAEKEMEELDVLIGQVNTRKAAI